MELNKSKNLIKMGIDYNNIPLYTDFMDEMKDMIKAILNGQHALRKELLGEIVKLRKNMEERFEAVDKQFKAIDKRFDAIDTRLDKLGSQLAYLEDDTPTREEHSKLEKRVEKIEHVIKH